MLRKKYKLRIPKRSIYNARELILDELDADYEEQFTRFTQFSRLLREVNKTAVVEIATKNGVFDKLFVSVVSSDDKELFIRVHSRHKRTTFGPLQAKIRKRDPLSATVAYFLFGSSRSPLLIATGRLVIGMVPRHPF